MSESGVVTAFEANSFLNKFADQVRDAQISWSDLEELTDAEAVSEVFGITTKIAARKVATAIKDLLDTSAGGGSAASGGHVSDRELPKIGISQLPEGKR